MRIMIVTDAWFPQTNGVVSTLAQTAAWLGRFGHEVRMITPRDFRSVACPTYPEIRLSLLPYKKVKQHISAFSPQAVHIATEGPLGLSAREASLTGKGTFPRGRRIAGQGLDFPCICM